MVTIEADGRVSNVEVTSGPPLLQHGAVENMKRWIFDRPAAAPFIENFIYDFEIDESACQKNGCEYATEVTYDLPEHLKVIACPGPVQVDISSARRK